MLGLESFSHITVLFWFHENDTPEKRKIMQVHPCNNPDNPLTGVFATRSPLRPNLIAMTTCRIMRIVKTRIYVDHIDARDNSPLIDIKCYIPDGLDDDVLIPDWVGNKSDRQDKP